MRNLFFLFFFMALAQYKAFARVVYKSASISIHAPRSGSEYRSNEFIDFNGDGTNDFVLILQFYTIVQAVPGNPCLEQTTLYRTFDDHYAYASIVPGSGFTDVSTPISGNILISNTSHTWESSLTKTIYSANFQSYSYMPFITGCVPPANTTFTSGIFAYLAAGYLGVKFKISGLTHYGWINIEAGQIRGTAYETIPGYPIRTGDKIGFFGSTDPNYNTIKGNVFNDLNGNCIKEVGEEGIPQRVVYTYPGNFTGYTDSKGDYEILVNGGTNTYNIIIDTLEENDLSYTISCASSPVSADFTDNNQIVSNKNFGLRRIACSQLKVNISSNRRRRCFRNTTTVNYQNSGSLSSSPAELKVIMPTYVRALSSSPNWTNQDGDTLFYDLGVIAENSGGIVTIIDSVACLSGVTGLTQCTQTLLSPKSNCIFKPLWDESEVSITGSCSGSTYQIALKNSGSGNMEDSLNYRIFLNDTLVKTGKFKLVSQTVSDITIPAHGSTVRIEADQNSYHPDLHYAYLVYEGCGDPVSDYMAKGFIASMPFNQGGRSESASCLTIIDSFDPNDKSVLPEGFGTENKVLQNTDLTYTINFQNTGTDTAYTVVLVDTLDASLDLTTLNILSASHAYKLEVTGKSSPRLVWIFPEINLVDATTNEPKSHGFVTYTVAQKQDVSLGTDIKNKAHIFFDYNEAIITNETSNRIGTYPSDPSKGTNIQVVQRVTGISRLLEIQDLIVYPNPSESEITIETSESDLEFEISNLIGTILKSGALSQSIKINLYDLPKGIYYLKIFKDEKFLMKKVIKN